MQTGVDVADLLAVFQKGGLHPPVLEEGAEEHDDYHHGQHKGQLPVDEEEENKGADDFDQRDKEVFRAVVGHFGDVEEVGDQLAHHLAGVVGVVVGEGEGLVVVKETLSHVPLHVGPHHVALIADVVFAQGLNDVGGQQGKADGDQTGQDGLRGAGKETVGGPAEELGIGQVYQTDEGGAQEVQEEDRLVWPVIGDEVFECVHRVPLFSLYHFWRTALIIHIRAGKGKSSLGKRVDKTGY